MIKRNHWAVPGFSALALLTLAACSGGGGGGNGGGGGVGGTPSTGAGAGGGGTTPPVVDFAIPNPYADVTSDSPNKLDTLHVFGDSYSDTSSFFRTCGMGGAGANCVAASDMWSERLVRSVPGASLNTYARDGASALDGGVYGDATNDFKTQVDSFVAGSSFGANDLSVVYMGYNDVNALGVGEHDPSIADYETQVQRLIAAGATDSERRLFLTLLHDFGDVPSSLADPGADKGGRTVTVNDGIADIVNGKSNVVAVDMFTVFERIAADPARYGLTNVTDAVGPGDDASTYLYTDGEHFTARGQEIIAQVYNHYLTRGWDLANTLQGSTANRDQLNSDVDDRLAELASLDAGKAGFSTFFVGDDRAAAFDNYDIEMGDPSRSGFAQLSQSARADAGIGLNYALDGATRLGVVMSRYDGDDDYNNGALSTNLGTESDAVSLFVDTKAGPFSLRTKASFANDTYDKVTFDDVVGESHGASHDGRTMSVSQTASTAHRVGKTWLQPWVNLTHTRQEIDGYTISNPYVSDLTYSGAETSETLASIGLNATGDRLALSSSAGVTFSGGLSYTRSLGMDDYEVTVREEALRGLEQTETVERADVETVGIRLSSVFDMGEAVSLSADYALTKQLGFETDHAVTARFNYRF